ncbi:kinesin-14 [Naegleria gruberi]|uniref:Kinesin-14 n=1 Tax=Naegleria gruberi TaxID=5762 RepID=D2V9R0_NAEGR|nr:kinesin-14 [Naegleria gruberi]EFC46509.1 kinesin-14 [Naegleria gruberi]|eukprot:XP_002679253.1 kinesin-14 [Naegleria gruberi]
MSTLTPNNYLKRKRSDENSPTDQENVNPNKKTSKIPVLKHSNSSSSLNSSTLSTNKTTPVKPTLPTRTNSIRANATSKINMPKPTSTPSTRVSHYQKTTPNSTNPNARQFGSVSGRMLAPGRTTQQQQQQQQQLQQQSKVELEQTKSQLSLVSEENNHLKTKIDEQTNQLKDLGQLEERTKFLSTQANKFQEENFQLKSTVTSQEIEISAMKGVQERLQSDNIDLRVKVSSLEKEVSMEKKQAEMDKATIKIQYESELRIQKETFEQQITEITEIKDKELSLTKDRLTREITKYKTDLEKTQFDLSLSVEDANSKAEKIRSLEEIIRQQAEDIKSLESKRHKDENERRRLHNLIQELKGNIRVYCRVKPAQNLKCIDYPENDVDERSISVQEESRTSATGASVDGKKAFFEFDKVFKPNSKQSEIFHEISQLVQSALDGFKVCIFAYGQTGSGKTFTMEGPPRDVISKLDIESQKEVVGMIPRSVDQIFESAERLKERGWTFSIVASFVEIYNETIRDLLDSTTKDNVKHEIKHTKDGSTSVTGIKYVNVSGPQHVQDLLKIASKNRAVAATQSNDRSSRSHSVFTLQITGRNDITDQTTQGALNLVDLAGSERIGTSQPANGERVKETQNINLSLTCLSNVVNALLNKSSHVPYRDSKLTYLLQNCLGKDAKTLMFVNIDPDNVNESLQSLRFAAKVNSCEVNASRKVK